MPIARIGQGLGIGGGTSATSSGAPPSSGFANIKSIELDGANEYVELPSAAMKSIFNSASAVTLSAWFKAASLPGGGQRVFQMESDDAGGNWLFAIRTSGTAAQIGWRHGASGTYGLLAGSTTLSTDTWYHVAAVFDGSATSMKIYIDGSLVGTNTSAGAALYGGAGSAEKCSIGATGAASNPWDGKIDEVAVFSSALTAENISTIYGPGTPAALTGTAGWWRMGDGTGDDASTVNDMSGNGNNGTLRNGPTYSTDVPS